MIPWTNIIGKYVTCRKIRNLSLCFSNRASSCNVFIGHFIFLFLLSFLCIIPTQKISHCSCVKTCHSKDHLSVLSFAMYLSYLLKFIFIGIFLFVFGTISFNLMKENQNAWKVFIHCDLCDKKNRCIRTELVPLLLIDHTLLDLCIKNMLSVSKGSLGYFVAFKLMLHTYFSSR